LREDLKTGREFITFDQYVFFMKKIKASDLNDKIDLFFKIIDTDGNGMLSYEEVLEICETSLKVCFAQKDAKFILFVSEFFTDLIFWSTNIEKNDEIPMPKIKLAINQNCGEAELLALFCGIVDFKHQGNQMPERNSFDYDDSFVYY
jgi:hypothetical protein